MDQHQWPCQDILTQFGDSRLGSNTSGPVWIPIIVTVGLDRTPVALSVVNVLGMYSDLNH